MLVANVGKTLRLAKIGSSLGACVLAKSARTSVQAFRYGQFGFGRVWAQKAGHELGPNVGRQLEKDN